MWTDNKNILKGGDHLFIFDKNASVLLENSSQLFLLVKKESAMWLIEWKQSDIIRWQLLFNEAF